ncbi:MAG: vitamin B12 dependent-methionine synthase activation domain-containing protein [bacterium]
MPALDYRLDRAELLRYLGWRGQEISADMEERLKRVSRLCLETSDPRWVWQRFNFTPTAEGIALHGTGTVFRGQDLRRHLEGAAGLCVLCVTLGQRVERTLLRLQAANMTDALLYNAATTVLIEAASERCAAEIRAAEPKYYVNGRYSPGYGDFPLSQQGELLALSGAGERLGVTLTEGLLMLPRKSVTAVLGLFSEEKGQESGCKVCAMREYCTFRRTGEHCG